MYKKILVAVDGSDVSYRALEKAAKLAVSNSAELVILHAIHQHFLSDEELAFAKKCCGERFSRIVAGAFLPKHPVDESVGGPDSYQNYIEAQDKFFHVYGTEILNRAEMQAKGLGVKTVKLVSKDGEPSRMILSTANQEQADLVVVGRHGHSPIIEFFLGSTAKTIMQYANRSVLTVE